jgi:DNA-binding LacI/PurR family transcriptional regulator
MLGPGQMTRVGIKDVARTAGVSVTTVSHALNGKGRLPARTRERVRRVALELGYRPNATARNLAGGRTGLLGMAVSQADGQPFVLSDFAYFAQLMSAAASAAIERGFALVLTPPARGEGPWSGIDVDGAVIVDPVRGDPYVRALREAGVPVVTTGRVPDDPVDADRTWVDADHVGGTIAVLEHLRRSGARRIALVTSPLVTSYAIDGERAYREWCAAHDNEVLVATAWDSLTEASGYAATAELLQRPDPPDAVYATLDRLALGALLAAQSHRVRVPQDLLVAGCTDSTAARAAKPGLTALSVHPDEVGRRAVQLLADLVEGEEPAQRRIVVPTRIVARGSTRRRAAGAI